jgi:hypothetical protein
MTSWCRWARGCPMSCRRRCRLARRPASPWRRRVRPWVAERVGVEPQAAWTQVRAVLGTLSRDVPEMQAVRQRLPPEFAALMA